MSRISIDVTDAQHQKLKALAALQGKTIKEFVLASTLEQADDDAKQALHELETLLDRRLKRAKTEGYSTRTVEEIFQQVIDKAGPVSDG